MDEKTDINFAAAGPDDLPPVREFLQPFVDQKFLLPRTDDELKHLMMHAFVAREGDQVVGFAAVEVYSRKLAEIQCLAVSPTCQRRGVGRELVNRCVAVARENGVLELMAISASEDLFRACGFDYSLPNQKRALFIATSE